MKRKKKAQSIINIRKKFKNRDEWLLIRVIKFDRKRTLPLTGELLAHSKDKYEIEREAAKYKSLIYITHSNPGIPPGYATAF